MVNRISRALPESGHVRCFTRALKNASYLQTIAPDIFATDPSAEGFGTGVPIEILHNLHRLRPNSPILNRHKAVAEFLRKNKLPVPGRIARDALFSGTVHFAQVTFHTSGGNLVIPTADMNMIVQYAQHAAIPISEYAGQYGPNSLSISPNLITYTANVPSASFTDADLQGWVNDMANQNHLPSNSCIFVISPQGLTAPNVSGNAGYHRLANIPYIVAGVFAQNLTLQDLPDVYAMVISHEMAEMVVDPRTDGQNPEVCDPCDVNCQNLTRIYFDASDNFLGTNQASPPSGFTFSYYICSVVKPGGASSCPASATDCQYAPVTQDCQLIIDKSTFGQDEIDIQLPGTATFPGAYWVALDGFTGSELGFVQPGDLSNSKPTPAPVITVTLDPALNPTLTATQLASINANLPKVNLLGPLPIVAEDPTLQLETQRFLYPYTISFNGDSAFTPLQLDEAAIVTLDASITIGQITRTASANIELVKGENPYFVDVDPHTPTQPSWLSFDLRFFKVVVAPNQTTSRFGASMTTNPADAPNFIANVIHNLTQNNGNVGGDSFDGLTQDEGGSALEFLQEDNNGNFAFNFTIARVRLNGKTPGAQAKAVRVFFRLFQAQTTASNFNEQTTYRFATDGVLNGHKIPLLGVQNDQNGAPEYVTLPCFATPRVNLAGPADMSTQTDPPNVQTINVNPGVEVDTFFGCWLDINQPQQVFLPITPPTGNSDGPWSGFQLYSLNQVITRAPHQCLIAEIRFDDTPIPTGATSSTSDKLAQRNIAWIDGPNPGAIDSRRMPHPFEIQSTPAQVQTPDELMILWGNTPEGSKASLYLPWVSATEILSLANSMYKSHQLTVEDAHTIQCPVGGVTFIPIPVSTARNAGLMTVDLPAGIRKGQIFDIIIRQITNEEFTPSPPIGRAKRALAMREDQFSWRSVIGAFKIAIVISTKEQLLFPEERLLAWLRWIQQTVPLTSRWYPVVQLYIEQIAGRVLGFGGDPNQILPSPTGTVPHPKPGKGDKDQMEFTGKVVGIIHDRFGDFEGFLLLMESGEERKFRGHEHQIEKLVYRAWEERAVISVFVEHHQPHWPVSIVVRRAPEPFQH
jgi:hypothetical protein